MIRSLNEDDLKRHNSTESLPIFDAEDSASRQYLCRENSATYAEVIDSFQFLQLLHRQYYRPVAAIRYRDSGARFIRVYFLCLHFAETVARRETIGVGLGWVVHRFKQEEQFRLLNVRSSDDAATEEIDTKATGLPLQERDASPESQLSLVNN